MTGADVALGMYLKNQAGWNQTEADWRRFLELEPDGCFVAELDGRPVGTATTCVLDSIGWIGMVLVEKSVRGRGVGTRLMEHCLKHLAARGVPTVRLDATPLGRPVYEKLGFVVEYELLRMEGVASGGVWHPDVGPVATEQLDVVLELDLKIRGTNRHRLIKRLYDERPEAMHAFVADDEIVGYLTSRRGAHATQIGPAVTADPEAGRALADVALRHCIGQRIFIDIPVDNAPAVHWARSRGLSVQRPLVRMRRGEPIDDQPAHQWASAGPEKG